MKAPKSIIQRITASNGSVFTGPGTNSYLIGTDDITLVDPGPKIDAHLSNLLELGKIKSKEFLSLILIQIIRQVQKYWQKS